MLTVMLWRGTALCLLSCCGEGQPYAYCHSVERDSFMLTVMVWRRTALCLLSWCGEGQLYAYCHGVERDSFMLTVMLWRGTALCLLSWCGRDSFMLTAGVCCNPWLLLLHSYLYHQTLISFV